MDQLLGNAENMEDGALADNMLTGLGGLEGMMRRESSDIPPELRDSADGDASKRRKV